MRASTQPSTHRSDSLLELACGADISACQHQPAFTDMQGGLPVAPGSCLELAVADLTRPDSLVPDITANVRAVISCTAPRVTPKEGDTADREKYRQVRNLGIWSAIRSSAPPPARVLAQWMVEDD